MSGMNTVLRWKKTKNKKNKTKQNKNKKTLHFDVHVYQEDVVWQFFKFPGYPREDSLFLQ